MDQNTGVPVSNPSSTHSYLFVVCPQLLYLEFSLQVKEVLNHVLSCHCAFQSPLSKCSSTERLIVLECMI